MKELCLKNDTKVIVRDGRKEDAQKVIDFYNEVGGETPFLSFGGGEYKSSLTETESSIESYKTSNNSTMLIAFVGEEIASIATIDSNQKAKGKHVGVLGIVVKEMYWGLGLGKELMLELINFCQENGITKKITLVTNEENTKAIDLYKNVGFNVDAILEKENFYGGKYTNLVRMSLLLEI